MKTCKQLYADRELAWQVAWETYNVAIGPALRAEFPIGSKVLFPHGSKMLEGVVEGYGEDYAPSKLTIRAKSGTKWQKEAHELEKV